MPEVFLVRTEQSGEVRRGKTQYGPKLVRVNKKFIIWLCLTLYHLKREPWQIGLNKQFTEK